MLTYTKIATVTAGSGGAATMSFSNIPQNFTDLVVIFSGRASTGATVSVGCSFNGDAAANYSSKELAGSGASASSFSPGYSPTNGISGTYVDTASYTASIFGNSTLYISGYSSSTKYKPTSMDAVTENNASASYTGLSAGVWNSTAPITSMSFLIYNSYLFAQYSSATLYGVGSYVTSRDYAPSSIPSVLNVGDTITIPYTGAAQTIALPRGINTVGVACYGASGGGNNGSSSYNENFPGYAYGIYPLNNAPLTIYAYVGGKGTSYNGGGSGSGTNAGGFNGGGNGSYAGNTSTGGYGSAGGGGATDVRIGGTALSNRVIVAGGAGGRSGGIGGKGAYTSGGQGTPLLLESFNGQGGFGGTQSAGGALGSGRFSSENGVAGTSGTGGNGGNLNGTYGAGAGGGGGYYGGGGGGGHSNGTGGGGGGGSSYIGSLLGTITGGAVNTGNGVIKITVLS